MKLQLSFASHSERWHDTHLLAVFGQTRLYMCVPLIKVSKMPLDVSKYVALLCVLEARGGLLAMASLLLTMQLFRYHCEAGGQILWLLGIVGTNAQSRRVKCVRRMPCVCAGIVLVNPTFICSTVVRLPWSSTRLVAHMLWPLTVRENDEA